MKGLQHKDKMSLVVCKKTQNKNNCSFRLMLEQESINSLGDWKKVLSDYFEVGWFIVVVILGSSSLWLES